MTNDARRIKLNNGRMCESFDRLSRSSGNTGVRAVEPLANAAVADANDDVSDDRDPARSGVVAPAFRAFRRQDLGSNASGRDAGPDGAGKWCGFADTW